MKFYVANTTKQHWTIFFRVPENPKLMEKKCPAGSQVLLHEGSQVDIDALIEQLSRYGGVRASEIDRSKDFIGHCWSIDKEVRATDIARAMRHNGEVLEVQGFENRKNMAAATHQNLNQIAQDGGSDIRVGHLRAETEEVFKPGDQPRAGGGSEAIEVSTQGIEPRGRGRPKRAA